ncbi:hypothetical protein [Cryptosporangium aurantiacum]|uniref:Uncharacterized protein n=1 Tax=Cryptosporangium aurantiacum TaxID=134849 RepID=A0A1M7PS41_9ACTN|nr:hypothetical protein [Cryptosporangium aurantiacum]SHN20245.1 hypothetical protein SAMN05443668_103632 [Cryptosporangium aurantiacum]
MEFPAAYLIARNADAHRMAGARLDAPAAGHRPSVFGRLKTALTGIPAGRSVRKRAPRRARRAAEAGGCAPA